MTDPSPRPDPDEAPDLDRDTAAADAPRASGPHPSGSWWPLLAVAVVTYLPFLATRPGWISADTKSYLYLDPGRLIDRAWSMWDPHVGLGTVSHQTIGYLWPMGPWFWVFDRLGVPDWVAQRLWWGTLLFAATAGMAYLLRRFEVPAVALWPAALAFGLSPYSVAYLGRLSGVLLPFVGLPWLLAFTILSVRTKGWRYPALFALTVTTVGSVNLTALVLVGIAPLLWLAYVVATRQASLRVVAATVGRIGVLSLGASAWWLGGLSVQATHGIDIVRYSESAEVVARTAVAFEVLRGLGYWFFYGGDKLQLWIEPSFQYTKRRVIFAGTFVIPWLALASGVLSRWRHRAYFVLLLVVGVVVSVGAHPWNDPSGVGRVIKAFLGTERGLAFRSLPRAVPLIALASAALVAGLIAGAVASRPRLGRALAGVVVVASIFAMVPLWQRSIVQDSLARREVPDYWLKAAHLLDARDDGTRVLAVPGSDFASYRWGNTVDPILPGLMDRPYVARELVPYGTPPSADLLNDFDLLLQERTLEPQAIAPLARLMRVGDIVVRGDLQYDRYNLARPRLVWDLFRHAPGLGTPIALTPPTANQPTSRLTMHDETWLLQEDGLPDGPALAIIPVHDSRPIIDVKPATGVVVLSGDGAGIVDAATAGRIDGSELLRYSASLTPAEVRAELNRGASLVITDTNRKRGERWGSLRHTRGETERVDQVALAENLTDNRLPRFADRGSEVQTVTIERGHITADATSYGNPITFAADSRPALAVDGDPDTQWATAAFSDARGERLELSLDASMALDHVVLQQLPEDRTRRRITRVRIDVGDGDPVIADLTPASRTSPGQRIELGDRRTSKVTITVLADNLGNPSRYGSAGPVGFAEVGLGDEAPTLQEVVRLPTDLVDAAVTAGPVAADSRVTYLFTRIRQDPSDRTRDDEERGMDRRFRVATDRTFVVRGTARVSARADDLVLDRLLGTTADDVAVIDSSRRLSGTRAGRASAALDGDPTTAWVGPYARTTGEALTVTTKAPRTFDRLDLQVVADGAHSVPTALTIRVDGKVVAQPQLPPITAGTTLGHTVAVPVTFPATTGKTLAVEIAGVDPVRSIDWTSTDPIDHPVAIAELGIPGLRVDAPPARFDDGCRGDLVTVDGVPLPVRVLGSTVDAEKGRPLTVEACGTEPLRLAAGDHDLHVRQGIISGLDVDQLVLDTSVTGSEKAPATAPLAKIRTDGDAADHTSVTLTGLEPGRAVWLVLGQSNTDGWTATTASGRSLGPSQLVDGYANGWLVTPDSTSLTVNLRFTPQRRVDAGIALSALAIAACLILVFRRPRDVVAVEGHLLGGVDETLNEGWRADDDGVALSIRGGLVLGLATVIAVGLVTEPVTALALGGAAAAAGVTPWGRRALRLLPATLLGAAVAYGVWLQVRADIAPGIEWVSDLGGVHPIAMAAVVALGLDAVVEACWRRRGRQSG